MSTITIERAKLALVLEALDLAQSLLEKSRHHSKIIEAYTVIKQDLAVPVQEPVALRDALVDSLGCVYVCDRVWSAWSVGTMTQDDFFPAAESDDVLNALVEAVAKATPPAPVPLTQAWRDSAKWLRNNYQDHPNIASLCDAMVEYGSKQ